MTVVARVWTLALADVLRTYRRPVNLLWIVVLPLVFAVGVGSLFSTMGDPPSVLVVDEDGGALVQTFLERLEAVPLRVRRVARQEAEEFLASGRERAALVLPPGFSAAVAAGRPQLEVLHGPSYEPGLAERAAQAVAASLASGGPAPELPVRLEPPRPAADPDRYPFLRMSFGLYAMFALATAMNQAAGLHRDRELGIVGRVLALGVPYGEILAGRALALGLAGAIQAAVILGATGALGAPWLAAGVPALLVAVGATLFAACGSAMALAGVTRTAAQVTNAAALASTAAAMLGGAFWPLDVVPAAVQQVGRLSPVYWAVDAVRQAFAHAGPLAGQAESVAVLVLMGLLGIAVGVVGLRRWAA